MFFYSLDLIGNYWDPENTLMLVETNLPSSYLAGFLSIGRMVFIGLGLVIHRHKNNPPELLEGNSAFNRPLDVIL
jgi:hypothetical protein